MTRLPERIGPLPIVAACLLGHDHTMRGPEAVVITRNPSGSWNVHSAYLDDAETNRWDAWNGRYDIADWGRATDLFIERVRDRGMAP